jgi:hypothetical protein
MRSTCDSSRLTAHALEEDAVSLDLARLGDSQQQQVRLFKGARHARQEAAALPARQRRGLCFTMRTRVVVAQKGEWLMSARDRTA